MTGSKVVAKCDHNHHLFNPLCSTQSVAKKLVNVIAVIAAVAGCILTLGAPLLIYAAYKVFFEKAPADQGHDKIPGQVKNSLANSGAARAQDGNISSSQLSSKLPSLELKGPQPPYYQEIAGLEVEISRIKDEKNIDAAIQNVHDLIVKNPNSQGNATLARDITLYNTLWHAIHDSVKAFIGHSEGVWRAKFDEVVERNKKSLADIANNLIEKHDQPLIEHFLDNKPLSYVFEDIPCMLPSLIKGFDVEGKIFENQDFYLVRKFMWANKAAHLQDFYPSINALYLDMGVIHRFVDSSNKTPYTVVALKIAPNADMSVVSEARKELFKRLANEFVNEGGFGSLDFRITNNTLYFRLAYTPSHR